jgi:hypothetical protein
MLEATIPTLEAQIFARFAREMQKFDICSHVAEHTIAPLTVNYGPDAGGRRMSREEYDALKALLTADHLFHQIYKFPGYQSAIDPGGLSVALGNHRAELDLVGISNQALSPSFDEIKRDRVLTTDADILTPQIPDNSEILRFAEIFEELPLFIMADEISWEAANSYQQHMNDLDAAINRRAMNSLQGGYFRQHFKALLKGETLHREIHHIPRDKRPRPGNEKLN